MGQILDILDGIWKWLPQFTKGDLPSWIAVAIAVVAILLVFRKPRIHSELHLSRLHVEDDGGPINLEAEFTTYSHAARIDARATLKLDGISYPMSFQPLGRGPQNYRFASVSTFHLSFVGEYPKSQPIPKYAVINVKAKMSDGSGAQIREKMPLVPKDEDKAIAAAAAEAEPQGEGEADAGDREG